MFQSGSVWEKPSAATLRIDFCEFGSTFGLVLMKLSWFMDGFYVVSLL